MRYRHGALVTCLAGPGIVYIHTVKTGGTTASNWLREMGIATWDEFKAAPNVNDENPQRARSHDRICNRPSLAEGRRVVSCIRDPLEFYRSMWCYFSSDRHNVHSTHGSIHEKWGGLGDFKHAIERYLWPITQPPGQTFDWAQGNEAWGDLMRRYDCGLYSAWIMWQCASEDGDLLVGHWWRTEHLIHDMRRDLTAWGIMPDDPPEPRYYNRTKHPEVTTESLYDDEIRGWIEEREQIALEVLRAADSAAGT